MAVTNKKELMCALKEKSTNIEITGNYAEEVMEKYSKSFFNTPLSRMAISGPIMPLFAQFDQLSFYEIETYQKNHLLIRRKA